MLATLTEVLSDAQKKKYAVGLFNTVNLEMAKGVIQAAEECNSPVIIGTAEILLPYASLEELAPILIPLAVKAKVPVVLHFDHGLSKDCIYKALKLGFTSVMYDCSTLSYEDNLKEVALMTKIAHAFGASIEAELGHVGANEGAAEQQTIDKSIYTNPLQAKEFVEKTMVDALAIAIGTAHGAYRFAPKLDLDTLKEIRSKTAVPLVLHGGSGLSDDDFKNCIENGISKVNIFTDINNACAKAAHDGYKEGCGITDLMKAMSDAVMMETAKKMKLFGSMNKA